MLPIKDSSIPAELKPQDLETRVQDIKGRYEVLKTQFEEGKQSEDQLINQAIRIYKEITALFKEIDEKHKEYKDLFRGLFKGLDQSEGIDLGFKTRFKEMKSVGGQLKGLKLLEAQLNEIQKISLEILKLAGEKRSTAGEVILKYNLMGKSDYGFPIVATPDQKTSALKELQELKKSSFLSKKESEKINSLITILSQKEILPRNYKEMREKFDKDAANYRQMNEILNEELLTIKGFVPPINSLNADKAKPLLEGSHSSYLLGVDKDTKLMIYCKKGLEFLHSEVTYDSKKEVFTITLKDQKYESSTLHGLLNQLERHGLDPIYEVPPSEEPPRISEKDVPIMDKGDAEKLLEKPNSYLFRFNRNNELILSYRKDEKFKHPYVDFDEKNNQYYITFKQDGTEKIISSPTLDGLAEQLGLTSIHGKPIEKMDSKDAYNLLIGKSEGSYLIRLNRDNRIIISCLKKGEVIHCRITEKDNLYKFDPLSSPTLEGLARKLNLNNRIETTSPPPPPYEASKVASPKRQPPPLPPRDRVQ